MRHAMSSGDAHTSGPAAASWSLFGVAMPSDTLSAGLARNWWAVGLRGLAGIAFGLIALLLPGLTLASLVLLFAAYMVVDGIFAVIAAVRAARSGERWGLLVLEGIADFVAGAIAFFLAVDHGPRLCLSAGILGDRQRGVDVERRVSPELDA
jgi:uncharacterized membrane protein HdeD (DUF308 family)